MTVDAEEGVSLHILFSGEGETAVTRWGYEDAVYESLLLGIRFGCSEALPGCNLFMELSPGAPRIRTACETVLYCEKVSWFMGDGFVAACATCFLVRMMCCYGMCGQMCLPNQSEAINTDWSGTI